MSDDRVHVTLPTLGEDVTEATISRWLVAPGDDVDEGDPLLEVATDKVDTEIPAPHTGTLLEILVGEGEVVGVGVAVAIIAVSTGTAEPIATTAPVDSEPPSVVPQPPQSQSSQPPAPQVQEVTEPAASEVASASASMSEGALGATQRLPRIRQIIAQRMRDSLHSSAQLTSVVEIDVTGIRHLRASTKAEFLDRTGVKLSFLPFFAKAAIEALRDHPVLGATVNAECTEMTTFDWVDLGIAVDSPKGLMVPVIRRADSLSIAGIGVEIATLAEQVRAGTINPDALTGGTFTITNTGSRGALFDTPILNSPQSGILGTGAVVERAMPRPDCHGNLGIAVRSMVYFALTYDHRIVDGADAARFLTTIKGRLESGFTAEELFATSAPATARPLAL